MMMALPLALLMFSCSSTRNTQTVMTTGTETETTAMTGDMTDTSGVLGTAANVTTNTDVNNTSIYSTGSATVTPVIVTEFNSRNNWKGDQTYVITEPVTVETYGYNAWTATPRSNWYNRYNTTGDDWMNVYYRDDNVLNDDGTVNDTSAIFGGWQLTMTPEVSTAWRNDNNDLGYVYSNWNNGQPYVSGSAVVTPSGTQVVSGTVTTPVTVSSSTWNNTMGASPNVYAANGNMYAMPKINLFLNNGSFTGFTGCNAVSGRLAVNGDRIHFENTSPSTSIDCAAGFDQSLLLDRLKRVDNYVVANSQLQLRSGDEVLLVLNKSN